MVALKCPSYSERPQIAEVLSTSEELINVRWYDGRWSTKWKVYTYKHRETKQIIPWDEQVHRKYLLYRNVKFTASDKLTNKCKEDLKKLYQK